MVWTNRPSMPAGHRVTATDIDAILDQIEDLSDQLVFGAVYKSSDESVTSSTAYQDDNHLFFSVAANGVYSYELYMVYAAGAGGLNIRFTFPSGTHEAGSFQYDNTVAAPTTGDDWQALAVSGTPVTVSGLLGSPVPLVLRGTFFIGATGGLVQFQFTQNASNAAATTVRKGSRIIYGRMA